ncbi:PleD family two-component system response regulator [Nostoc sp. FACHB-973]|uniref:PleD family two-component system response regulator n=1 Tax=Desmonostoc muscorum LEGE 12446 TaxID=1828758 RepID=A0A8J7D2D5_DESMC|nr:PleD family two-component system response regulator [Desmonostoc muscorum]MBD2517836.1 PleD family two-component system response regulator [Nostoc sp. FACHB-973]MBX9255810.1 PleD family two-component system response regulator [Desmonostoc muscorum CCALA 125]MCF2150448.1 PleD family two-component system response regulator [Desmonostoc muscorum LEGE 12446]
MKATPQESQSLVLIVDDEPFIRMILRNFLEREAYQIVEAKNGIEALTVFKQLHPDIVLLDAMMPDMDGFECCTQLQILDSSKYTPVLMITGLEDEESVDRAFEVGAMDYVTKPIHWPVLRQRVKRLIQQSQLQQKLEAVNLELQRLVSIDGLTEVANRRGFEEYFYQEWQRMKREQRPLSLILCDVDFFKSYNDTYGHRVGDRCLIKIAQAIKDIIKRPGDLVARYGGEEFAIILPNTDIQGATHVAEKICDAVRTLAIPHQNSQVSPYVTLSAGFTTEIPQTNSDLEEMIAAADRALYQAKTAGRDRFVQNILATQK